MDVNSVDETSFFKIILDDSVDYIPLTTSFAMKYLGRGNNKKQTLLLKTKSSTVEWSVNYYKIEDRCYFIDGWLNFMKDNRLQMGDLLVFSLLSPPPKLTFQVFFYSHKSSLKQVPRRRSGNSGRTVGRRSLSIGRHVTTGGEDKRQTTEIMKKKKKPLVKEETSDDDSLENVQKTSLRRVVRKSYMRQLPMTKGFLKATGINIERGGMRWRLRNGDGKIWEVEMKNCTVQKRPCITSGWSDFLKDNKIKIGNSCEFNHVNTNLLHVRVLKKNESSKSLAKKIKG